MDGVNYRLHIFFLLDFTSLMIIVNRLSISEEIIIEEEFLKCTIFV